MASPKTEISGHTITNEDLGHDFEKESGQNNDDFNNDINEISNDRDDIRNAIFGRPGTLVCVIKN